MTNDQLVALAKKTIEEYYDGVAKETGTPVIEFEPWEGEVLVEMTRLWMTNDKPDATDEEIEQFMFDNRRL